MLFYDVNARDEPTVRQNLCNQGDNEKFIERFEHVFMPH